jgi:8-oxo-dGTP pyrophosphatase MutT (NUDIX family)
MSAALIARLRAALASHTTRPAHDPVAAELLPETAGSGIAAAVLVPLLAENGELHLLFTKRSETLPHHRGQVAFPGGRHVADDDPSLLATALREAEEEIGLDPARVDVLGALAPIHTFASNFLITPYVGVVPHPYDYTANPYEVAEIFTVPLASLQAPGAMREEEWQWQGRTVPVIAYRHGAHVIWGATQRITADLLELIGTLDRVDTPQRRS